MDNGQRADASRNGSKDRRFRAYFRNRNIADDLSVIYTRTRIDDAYAFFDRGDKICFAHARYDDISIFGKRGNIFCCTVCDADIFKSAREEKRVEWLADNASVPDDRDAVGDIRRAGMRKHFPDRGYRWSDERKC